MIKIKSLLILLAAFFATGCVRGPGGNFYPAPNVNVGVDGNVDVAPRVYTGSRSNVTVWLPSTYVVADAYPIAQAHCARWGYFASPTYDWTVSATVGRRLNYSCVNYRPVLSGPHIIIGSPFYRNHYVNWHRGGRSTFGRSGRRIYKGHRGKGYYNDRPVYTPKPVPRRRSTFGRIFNSRSVEQDTSVQRGKPWEHNRNKNKVIRPAPETSVQRGKPWEHRTRKGKITSTRRSTFGSSPRRGALRPKTKFSKRSSFGSVRSKNSGGRKAKGRLSL